MPKDEFEFKFPYHEMTPPCTICRESHVGIHSAAYVLLRGSYVFNEELGVELFVLDPDIEMTTLQLPNGQLAVALDVRPNRPTTAAVHEDCFARVLEEIGAVDSEVETITLSDDDVTDYEYLEG